MTFDNVRPYVTQSVCPYCHNRGHLPNGQACNCPSGEALLITKQVRTRLAAIWLPREIDYWMESRISALGGQRPSYLIQSGKGKVVLDAIERLPGLSKSD